MELNLHRVKIHIESSKTNIHFHFYNTSVCTCHLISFTHYSTYNADKNVCNLVFSKSRPT